MGGESGHGEPVADRQTLASAFRASDRGTYVDGVELRKRHNEVKRILGLNGPVKLDKPRSGNVSSTLGDAFVVLHVFSWPRVLLGGSFTSPSPFPPLFLLMLDIGSSVREETSKRGIYPVSSDVDLYFKGTTDDRGRLRTVESKSGTTFEAIMPE